MTSRCHGDDLETVNVKGDDDAEDAMVEVDFLTIVKDEDEEGGES